MKPFLGQLFCCLALLALLSHPAPLVAHPGHEETRSRPAGALVTERERQTDAVLIQSIQSERASEKQIEDYTDRLFERDGERPSEVTLGRLEAILEAALALSKFRQSKVVWHQWGALLFEEGYYDAALGAFGRALGLDPSFLPSLLGRGTAYLSKGKAGRAAESLLRAVEAAPRSRSAGSTWARRFSSWPPQKRLRLSVQGKTL